MIETGKRISLYIKAKGYNRMRLARILGISNTAVYKWQRGQSVPSIDNLVILSQLFDCTIDDLIVADNISIFEAEKEEGQQAINS